MWFGEPHRFPKEDHIPDWVCRDKHGNKGDLVESPRPKDFNCGYSNTWFLFSGPALHWRKTIWTCIWLCLFFYCPNMVGVVCVYNSFHHHDFWSCNDNGYKNNGYVWWSKRKNHHDQHFRMKSCTVCSKVPYLPEYEKFLMLNKYFYVVCNFKGEIIF